MSVGFMCCFVALHGHLDLFTYTEQDLNCMSPQGSDMNYTAGQEASWMSEVGARYHHQLCRAKQLY